MPLFAAIMISVALAMDCFTVSITCGMLQKKMGKQVWVMAILFGGFQAFMPLIGWSAAELLSNEISAYDHWIAFGLLAFLGGRMIYDGCRKKADDCSRCFDPQKLTTLLTLALATSIDAMAVGFSFIGMGMRTLSDVLPTIGVIGLGSFIFTVFGKWIGVNLGKKFNWPAEQVGGIILILIGIRVLTEHLCA